MRKVERRGRGRRPIPREEVESFAVNHLKHNPPIISVKP